MLRTPFQIALRLPSKFDSDLANLLKLYFDDDNNLFPDQSVSALLRVIDNLPSNHREKIRVSSEVRDYALRQEEKKQLARIRSIYENRLRESEGKLPFLKETLYDYQIQGMLHLAFHGRAILADEMGLGKTVQAVAAAAVMKESYGVKRVLVVSPASLKLEWEEQIRKFTALTSESVFRARGERLKTYSQSQAFFLLVNYEQVVKDADQIIERYRPDLIILDEAQRIKNWRTKTAQVFKRLETPYVFVLTGTPLENRIDDVYSLAELVDPSIFGSLFRFNRQYYQFDEKGKVNGMKNLSELHQRLSPIMLRRRKDEIQDALPGRTDKTFFVEMSKEQKRHYADHETIVSRLTFAAQKRPLKPEEFERLQQNLVCMRMCCDSCYILDRETTESLKIDELMNILSDYRNNEPSRKIIIFSEWTGMLELAAKGFISLNQTAMKHIFSAPPPPAEDDANRKRRFELAASPLATARRSLKMAQVLNDGDFREEAVAPAWKAVSALGIVLHLLTAETVPDAIPEALSEDEIKNLLSAFPLGHADQEFFELSLDKLNADDPELLKKGHSLLEQVEHFTQS